MKQSYPSTHRTTASKDVQGLVYLLPVLAIAVGLIGMTFDHRYGLIPVAVLFGWTQLGNL